MILAKKRYLLDTNLVLVALEAPERLTARARKLLLNDDLHVSVLTYWEVMLKSMKGKLAVGDVQRWWSESLSLLQAVPVPLHPDHISAIANLPAIHKDPFDRALLAQAAFERLTLLTADAILVKYASPLIRVVHAPIAGE